VIRYYDIMARAEARANARVALYKQAERRRMNEAADNFFEQLMLAAHDNDEAWAWMSTLIDIHNLPEEDK
jgi:hypothetical protein